MKSYESYIIIFRAPVTRLSYAATVKNVATHDIKKPTQADLDKVSPLKTCGCQGKKLRKQYIKGANSKLNYPAIEAALKSSWVDSNHGK